jgi:putative ABC transport system permease protein
MRIRTSLGFTLVAVLTLALGIGANTAIFSVIHGVLLRPLPFPEPERLVTLWESQPTRGIEQEAVSVPTFADWQAQSRAFENMAFWTGPSDVNFVTTSGSEKIRATYASSSLFPVLGVAPVLGRGFVAGEDQPKGPATALISHKLYQERFGSDPQVLGRTATIDTFGLRTYTIAGVMPPGFRYPEDTEIWLAAGWNGLPQNRRAGHWLNVLARLQPGVSVEQAQAEMSGLQGRIARDHATAGARAQASVVPLLQQSVGRQLRTALMVLSGVVAGVLLIACANVANMMLARGASRRKEIAVRLALGATRWRIVRQLLGESLVLALLGGVLGILFGFWGVKLLVALNPMNIPRLNEVSVDGTVLAFTAIAAMLTGIAFGLVPAWQCSRPDVHDALKDGSRGAAGSSTAGRTRAALVIAEVSLATVLLVAAGLMLQSFAKLMATNRGFRAEQLLVAELDYSVSGFTTWVRPTTSRPQVSLHQLLERIRQMPGVESAAASYRFLRRDNRPPIQSFWVFGRPTGTDDERVMADPNGVSPGFLRTLGLRLLRGRDLEETDTLEAPGAVLVNETFARRYFPNQDPIGQYLSMERSPGPLGTTNVYGLATWSEIVGVVSDVKSLSTQPEAAPEVYLSYWQWPMQNPRVYVRTSGDSSLLIAAVRGEVRSVIPNLPVPRIVRMTERVSESVAQPRFQAGLLTLFGALALVLAASGVYAVLAYSVTQRRREIGVRLALGAQRGNVFGLIIRQGLLLVIIGVFLGLAASLALTRVLQSLLYAVPPTDALTFVAVGLMLIAVAILACWLPARRATQVDPIEALRYE